MHNFLPFAWFEGQCIPFNEAKLSIATHALHYGTAAFGGMRAIPDPNNSKSFLLFRADKHAKRLCQSARFLMTELDEDFVLKSLETFLVKNKPTQPVYIRPFVYTSDLGIAPRLHNIETNFFIYGIELGDYLSPDGVTCRVSSWTRQQDNSLPLRGKISGAYITSSLAKTEAVKSGFDEALLLNSQGEICCATTANILVKRNNNWLTPKSSSGCLPGIMRQRGIDLNIVKEKLIEATPQDNDEWFLINSLSCRPIQKINKKELKISTNPKEFWLSLLKI